MLDFLFPPNWLKRRRKDVSIFDLESEAAVRLATAQILLTMMLAIIPENTGNDTEQGLLPPIAASSDTQPETAPESNETQPDAASQTQDAPSPPTPSISVPLPFAWSQTDDTLTVMVICPDNFQNSNVNVHVDEERIEVSFGTESEPRIRGKLWARVDRFSMVWEIQQEAVGKVWTLHLDKKSAEKWPILIRGPMDDEKLETIDPNSAFVLAQHIRETGNDGERAVALYQLAASKNHLEAIMTLGACHLLGSEELQNVPIQKNMVAAVDLYKKAASLGSVEAMYVLGGLYQQGDIDEGEPNYPMALQWFDRVLTVPGAKTKNRDMYIASAFQAGILCWQGGHGLGEANPARALTYWRFSIELGHPPSIYNAAILFLNGDEKVERDLVRATRLFAAANTLDPNLVAPGDFGSWPKEELQKLAALDADLQAKGERLSLPELLARFAAEQGDSQQTIGEEVEKEETIPPLVSQPQSRKSSGSRRKRSAGGAGGKKKSEKETAGDLDMLIGVGLSIGAIGLAIYLVRRYWWSKPVAEEM